eukprot:COSAG01_NODE_51387_length_355_cov_0.781250_1_plen_79_part_10
MYPARTRSAAHALFSCVAKNLVVAGLLVHGSRELFASTMDFPNLAGVRRLPHHYMNGASGFHGPDDTDMLATELRADIR